MKFSDSLKRIGYSFWVIPKGIKYIIATPKIWLLVLAPIVINILIFILAFSYVNSWASGQIDGLGTIEFFQSYSFVMSILKIFSWILSLILSTFIFLILGMIVSSPFNGVIVEKMLTDKGVGNFVDYSGFGLIVFEVKRSVAFELAKIFTSIVVLLFSFLINLIPVVGSILFLVINYGFQGLINVLDLTDPSFSRKEMRFKEKVDFVFKNVDLYVPFGAICTIFLTIPLINFLFLPVATVGATFLYLKIGEKSE